MFSLVVCGEVLGGQTHVFAIPTTKEYAISNHPPRVLITCSSPDPVHTSFIIPGLQFEVKTTITRYDKADIVLPVAARITNAGLHNKTIIIRSSSDVTVHAFDNDYAGGAGFLVLPSSLIGTEYRIPNYKSYGKTPPFFTITALYDGTSVHIVTKESQESSSVNLQQFESYRFNGAYSEDLTGTYIESDSRISVVSGVFTRIGLAVVYYPSGLLVNVPPIQSWGYRFILTPFLRKSSGYIYRVLSGNQTTTLNISNIGTVMLEPTAIYENDVTSMTAIYADFPVLVVKYMKGFGHGDPSMILEDPLERYYNSVTFPVFETTSGVPKRYAINVVLANCSDIESLLLDGTTSMTNWDILRFENLQDGPICCARGDVSPGV